MEGRKQVAAEREGGPYLTAIKWVSVRQKKDLLLFLFGHESPKASLLFSLSLSSVENSFLGVGTPN